MKSFVLLCATLAACTPGQHRAYQRTVASMTTLAYACDAGQTVYALRHDPSAVENNPIQRMVAGDHPGWYVTAGVSTIGSAVAWTIVELKRDSKDPMLDWLKDIAVTGWAMAEMGAVVNNAMFANRGRSCGL